MYLAANVCSPRKSQLYNNNNNNNNNLPVQSNEPLLISSSEVQENIKKKKNWKGTGKDRVTTFWIKNSHASTKK